MDSHTSSYLIVGSSITIISTPQKFINWHALGVIATVIASLIAIFKESILAYFFKPDLKFSLEKSEPFFRETTQGYWVRLQIKNCGNLSAQNCIVKFSGVTTKGKYQNDKDPVQLRWAGIEESLGFKPIHIGLNQREFINVLFWKRAHDAKIRYHPETKAKIVCIDDNDASLGFSTYLDPKVEHICELTIYSSNAKPHSQKFKLYYEDIRNIDSIILELC